MNFKLLPTLSIPKSPNEPNCWYYEEIRNRPRLCICAGDSWTWGDSLPKDPIGYRTQHIYGNLLATKLNADFVNISRCAASNIEIHDMVAEFLPKVQNLYQEIYLIITLTENGRELLFDPIWTNCVTTFNNLEGFQKEYERAMFHTFKETLLQYTNLRAIIGRNFTYTFEDNHRILDGHLLEKTWVDILAENQQLEPYPKNLRILSQMGLSPLIKKFKEMGTYNQLKPQFFNTFIDMEEAICWLDNSVYNFKYATRHPTEQGHALWAEYLFSQFKD